MVTNNLAMRLEEVAAKLKAARYRITPQRLAVIKALISSDEHPTVEKIYRQIRGDFPSTSIATVYNTLECLKNLGEVLELARSGGSRYDGRNPHPHPHLVCAVCGRIEDVDMDLRQAGERIADQRGYSDIRHDLEFTGVCPQCKLGSAKRTHGAG
jgi:Fur family peroxide stress response transcriptional regulator